MTEPTLADVLAEVRDLGTEVRRARLSEARVGPDRQTLIGSLADFRREYAAHPHDPGGG
jgi:hypothetical protein